FDAATFRWVGGNPFIDTPMASVERFIDGHWVSYADQGGEVQMRVDFPIGFLSVVRQFTEPFSYVWTANFEAPDFFPRDIDPRGPNVPDGTYRFVVSGFQKKGRHTVPYRLTSNEFEVSRWTGLSVASIK